MTRAISDTGPILHLHEINRLDALGVFARIDVPDRVALELERLGLAPAMLLEGAGGSELVVVSPSEMAGEVGEPAGTATLQPADRQVLALARESDLRFPVLTDDLALRQQIEGEGGLAVGTVGLLVRSFVLGRSDRGDFESAVERLMSRSSLHMSRPFRRYVLGLIRDLTAR